MNPKYEIHEWIDRYLNGEMSEEEKRAFENELRTDEQLAQTLEAQKVATKIVIGEELLQLKKQMTHDLNVGGYYTGARNKALWYYLTGALIAIVGLVYFFLRKDISSETGSVEIEKQETKEKKYSDTLRPVITNDSMNRIESPTRSNAKLNKAKKISFHKKQLREISCVDSIINFSCQARGTCLQKEEGAIEIDVKTIKSGKPPYRFSVLPNSGFSETTILSDLKPGKYQLYMMDSRQCISKLNVVVEVPVINCSK
jgi:hypothetical protein